MTRLDRLRALLDDLHLDAVLITDPTNRRYLTGYRADDHGLAESAGVAIVTKTVALLMVSPNNVEWARSDSPGWDVRAWKRPWESNLTELFVEVAATRVGFEDSAMLVSIFDRLGATSPAIAWTALDSHVDALRAAKDADEIATIRRAIEITDAALVAIAEELSADSTERAIARRIADLMRELGADGEAFPTAVGSGPNAARPHHRSGERRIRAGEPIVIDMGASVDGYCADLTRTLWLGAPPERLAAVYNAVSAAQRVASGAIRAGASCRAIDEATRASIHESGYGEHIVHGVGHGVGMNIHEAPSVSIASEQRLEVGQVITVEPGIYIPDWGGVRIEDVVVVTEGGYELLTAAPK